MTEEFNPAGNPNVEPPKKKRGRPPKAASEATPSKRVIEERRKRRRRSDFTDTANLKLHVPQQAKDDGFQYRWINDTANGRIFNKTQADDWDKVTVDQMNGQADPEQNSDGSMNVCRIVGSDRNTNQPMTAYLCRKPKDWYDEDKAKEQQHLDKIDEQLGRGKVPGVQLHKDDVGKIYVPQGHDNTIRRG